MNISKVNQKGIEMINRKIGVVTIAVGLALSAPSMAAKLSAAEYAAAETRISTEFATAKAACAPMSGNVGDICLVEAKGAESIAKADLLAKNNPTPETHLQAQITRAEAEFAASKERCDDLMGTAKSTCIQTAQSIEKAAKLKASKEKDMELSMSKTPTSPKSATTGGNNELRATDTLFDFDSAVIQPAGRDSLDDFVGKLQADSSAQVSIAGYADRIGSVAYNQWLSEQRMEAVRSYLVDKGIRNNQISAKAMGQTEPTVRASDCAGERSAAVIACLQPDRRVVVSTAELVSSR